MIQPTWTDAAACRKLDPTVFYPVSPENSGPWVEAVEAAKRVCEACPVRQECLDFALVNREPEGLWGGQMPKERRSYLRRMVTKAKREREARS